MKRILFVILIAISGTGYAQIAVKGMLFKPVGDLGAVMEKKITGEILYMNNFHEKWRSRFGLAYIPLHTRMDTFPVYAVMYDGSGTHVLPGYEVYHKTTLSYLFGGMDFRFIEDKKISPYVGLDILCGALTIDYDEYYETLVNGSNTGAGGVLGGLRFRAGAEYHFTDRFGVFIDISLAGYYVQEMGGFSNKDFGLGVHYVFNPD